MSSNFDIVVVGAGISGVTAAARASSSGARVLLLERADTPGGSALASPGAVWIPPNAKTLLAFHPHGDADRLHRIATDVEAALEEVSAQGVPVSAEWNGHYGWARARKVDMPMFFDRLCKKVAHVVTGVDNVSLIRDNAEWTINYWHKGARHSHHVSIVILATGGFQGSPQLREDLIGPRMAQLQLRSNPFSVGDGLRIALSAGGTYSDHLDAFYGHLVASPLPDWGPEDFGPMTQPQSAHGILVNTDGLRFADERSGDDILNMLLARENEQRGVLIWDSVAQESYTNTAPFPTGSALPRFDLARDAGARTAVADDIDDLANAVSRWGIPMSTLLRTINSPVTDLRTATSAADSSTTRGLNPLRNPPFYALEVRPSITAAYGGIRVDATWRVLTRESQAIPALYAVGYDAGGLQDWKWSGGLAAGLVSGRVAADCALAEL